MNHYSLAKLRSSLMHFVLGSFVSASMGLAATLLLVRELSVPDYSAYAIFLGFCLLIGGITSFAIEHTAQRFIPELLINGIKSQVVRYVFIALAVKMAMLAVAVICLIFVSSYLVDIFSLSGYVGEFQLWLLASFFIIFFRFQAIILQIFLLHKELKWLNIISSGGRLLLIVAMIRVGQLDLMRVVYIDLGINFSVFLLSSVALFIKLKMLPEAQYTQETDDRILLSRVREFMSFSALREFVYLFSGHAMNRLVIGKYVQTSSMGAFGFSQSLLEFVDRYLPSVFLNNMIQPVVMAKYSQHQDSTKVFDYGNLVLKINMFILIPLMVWGLLLGAEGSLYITNNKYPEAIEFFSALVFLLLLRSHNYPLQLAAIALEKTRATLWGSVILGFSIVFAIIFVKLIGVMGIVLARGIGMLVRDWYLLRTFNKAKLKARVDYWAITKSLLTGVIVFYLIMLTAPPRDDLLTIIVSGAASFMLFALGAFLLRVVSNDEIDMIKRLLRF
jgi:O-antigen/teichoic acid export membrane protein